MEWWNQAVWSLLLAGGYLKVRSLSTYISDYGAWIENYELEIIQKAIDDFVKIQRHMLVAKKENAIKTYASLKKEYHI